MKIIRSLEGEYPLLDDFYYARSEKRNNLPGNVNSFYFKSGCIYNIGYEYFESFANEMKNTSFVLNMGTSLINISNLNFLEIVPEKSLFNFHFGNNSVFNFEAPDDLQEPLKFNALCKILFDEISKAQTYETRTGDRISSLLSYISNYVKN